MAKRLHGAHSWLCPYCKRNTEQERLDSGQHLCAGCGESFTARESKEAKLRELKKGMGLIKVGVFPPDYSCRAYRAYTRYYNTAWPGCCEHELEAVNGTEAKKIAIREHKERCEESNQ